jgi:hypothetical protein
MRRSQRLKAFLTGVHRGHCGCYLKKGCYLFDQQTLLVNHQRLYLVHKKAWDKNQCRISLNEIAKLADASEEKPLLSGIAVPKTILIPSHFLPNHTLWSLPGLAPQVPPHFVLNRVRLPSIDGISGHSTVDM